MCLAQSETDAERFRDARRAQRAGHTGNLKLDVPAPPADPAKLEKLMSMTRGRPVIVAASTHPGEEEILIETHRTLAGFFPGLLTVIVPRHPDRGNAVAALVAGAGLRFKQRSREELPAASTDIYVADTLGELGLFYRLARNRVHGRLAGRAWRTESDRGGQARRCDRARPACVQFLRRL